MTKKDFFILIIKLFGLSALISSIFSSVPNNIFFALNEFDVLAFFWITAVIIAEIGLFILLVFKAEKVVKLLKLEKGFENDMIELGKLRSIEIIKLGFFIVGALLFLKTIPSFLSNLYWAFSNEVTGETFTTQSKFNLTLNGVNLLIGYLLATNYESVAKRFDSKEVKE